MFKGLYICESKLKLKGKKGYIMYVCESKLRSFLHKNMSSDKTDICLPFKTMTTLFTCEASTKRAITIFFLQQ